MGVKEGAVWPVGQVRAICLLILLIHTEMEQPKDDNLCDNILKLGITVVLEGEQLHLPSRGASTKGCRHFW